MRRWVLCVTILMTACAPGGVTPSAHTTVSPVLSASPAAGASPAASPSPTPSVTPDLNDPPVTAMSFSCRLPVIVSSNSGSQPPAFAGGFITFPGATLQMDGAGGINLGSDDALVTGATPTLRGGLSELTGPPFYDRALGRWLPAGSGQTTPDGAFYAYVTPDATTGIDQVHIVDVGRATERVLQVAVPNNHQAFTLADFDARGIYLVADNFENLPDGVWLLDPKSGAIHQIAEVGRVEAVRGDYAWAADMNPSDPSPPVLRRSGTPSDSIVRVDLVTGASVTWFYQPGLQVDMIGFDGAGMAVVRVTDPNSASTFNMIWEVPSAGKRTLVYEGGLQLDTAQGDGDRLWLRGTTGYEGTGGIYLFTPTGGLNKVFDFSGVKSDQSISPVGFCR